MTKKEAAQVLAVLKAAYPSMYQHSTKEDITAAVVLWAELFTEPYAVVVEAVKRYIVTDTSGFYPAIGKIKEHVDKLMHPVNNNEAEAWALLHRCICDGGKGFDSLPEDVRSLTTRRQVIDWGMLDGDAIQVVASNFQRAYRTREQVQKEERKAQAALPASVAPQIAAK